MTQPGAEPQSSRGKDTGPKGEPCLTVPVIEMHDIHKHYMLGARRLEVLKGITLSVQPGEYVAVMGPSGSGKSTLLNIIGLLDTAEAGRYSLCGQDVSRLDDDRLSRQRNAQIGFVFQTFNLFPQLDVAGNIAAPMAYGSVPRAERRERAAYLAERVGLGSRVRHRPRELSGGEMQRTAIARALACDPPLLLADEPTGNLDEKTGDEILAIFDELIAAGRTLVLVTHNSAYRQRVQRVVDMHDGRLV
jgi:putative ABC transport system ATP-binding protein